MSELLRELVEAVVENNQNGQDLQQCIRSAKQILEEEGYDT